MKLLLRLIVLIPLLLLFLYFAEANRAPVKLSLDPFPGGGTAGLSFEPPLYLVVLVSIATGVLLGGFSSWLAHRKIRRAARLAKAEAAKLQTEVGDLRRAALASLPSATDADKGFVRTGRP